MRKIADFIIYYLPEIYKGSLFLASILLIVYLFPRQSGFQHEFQQARPWMHDDLIAPFDFGVLKTEKELMEEQRGVMQDFIHYYSIDNKVLNYKLADLYEKFEHVWVNKYGENRTPDNGKKQNLNVAIEILDFLYNEKGVISEQDSLLGKDINYKIRLIKPDTVELRRMSDFYTLSDAYNYISSEFGKADNFHRDVDTKLLMPLLKSVITNNIYFDDRLNKRAIEEEIGAISPFTDSVQEGEKIISKGELVTIYKNQVLKSFRDEFNRQVGDRSVNRIILLGQFLLVSISIIVLYLFLRTFRKDVYSDNRKVILILVSILFMVLFTSIVVKHNIDWLHLVPVCIIPIIIRSFFDNKLALYVLIIAIIIIGFMVPNSFQFVFLQFVAGIIAILSMVTLRKRSQIFFTATLIFLTYSAVFSGLVMAQTGTFFEIEWMNYAYFSGSAALTLFSYPIIFLLERIFGMPTDFSLLELSDTNNKLLRELNMKAPGTFQHSLQVANLTEEAVIVIGGNPLLARTGALYHDIGKMDSAFYFTENQVTGLNPHDELTYEESASIIIDHVIKGIEKARKYNLPEYIIDFIRTHHGTTVARYFYTMAVKEGDSEEIDRKKYTYPGPKPFSKETAIMMMADAVEATSRSITKPTEKSINEMVENIINNQVEENQFDNADITLKDITTVKKIFKQKLKNIFHVRIAYPSDS